MSGVLNAQERDASKKSLAKKLRKNGKIPAVFYGKNVGNHPIAVDRSELYRVFQESGRNAIIDLRLNGQSHPVIAHEIQEDSFKGNIIHVDFLEVDMSSEIDAEVPILIVGESVGQKQGGVVQQTLDELEVRALPADIPNVIKVDITPLDIGDALKVSDIQPDGNYKIMNDGEEVIVTITPPVLGGEQDEGSGEASSAESSGANEAAE
jgi:large subunit ribosomal protein L25